MGAIGQAIASDTRPLPAAEQSGPIDNNDDLPGIGVEPSTGPGPMSAAPLGVPPAPVNVAEETAQILEAIEVPLPVPSAEVVRDQQADIRSQVCESLPATAACAP